MTGYDLMDKMSSLTALLDEAVRQYGKRGTTFAHAEQDYRIALRQEILKLRSDGTPVTLVPDLARGDAKIAKLKFDRDVAETVYKAAQEAIQSYKLQIRITESQIEREWGNTK